jgi:hypothetical protein
LASSAWLQTCQPSKKAQSSVLDKREQWLNMVLLVDKLFVSDDAELLGAETLR